MNKRIVYAMTALTAVTAVSMGAMPVQAAAPKTIVKSIVVGNQNAGNSQEIMDKLQGLESAGYPLPGGGCIIIAKPGQGNPGTNIPGIIIPGIGKPGDNCPDTDNPDGDKPGTDNPDTDKPEEDKPGTDSPDGDKPGTDNPDTDKPEEDKPGTGNPDGDKPGTGNPDGDKPGTGNPDTDNPGTEQPDEDDTTSAEAKRVLELVNEERARAGLRPLSLRLDVEKAANVRAVEIKASFSHTRPDGTSFTTALKEQGVSYKGAGENIAWGQRSPEQVMNAWMNSEGHRANILNERFTHIGIGHYKDAAGTDHWTQLFVY